MKENEPLLLIKAADITSSQIKAGFHDLPSDGHLAQLSQTNYLGDSPIVAVTSLKESPISSLN